MSRFAIRFPYLIIVICLMTVVIGISTLVRMPVDLFPKINIPVVVVATFYNGMPPEQIENDITGRFERFFTLASGKKAKYYKHLRDWNRGRSTDSASFDGITGASVGSGENLAVTVELADALLDAGYEIRVDSAVENKRDNAVDVKVPLTTQGAGQVSNGSGYIESFSYDL